MAVSLAVLMVRIDADRIIGNETAGAPASAAVASAGRLFDCAVAGPGRMAAMATGTTVMETWTS